MHIYIYMFVCVCMWVCLRVCACLGLYLWISVCVRAPVHEDEFVRVYIDIYLVGGDDHLDLI